MGRTFLVEDRIESLLTKLVTESQISVGLVVGQFTDQKDYVVHVVRTPKEDGKDYITSNIDDSWIANHAKQVHSMIPGGMEVMGAFITGPPKDLKAAQEKLKQLVFSIEKTLQKQEFFPDESAEKITDRVAVHVCSASRKVTCRTYDISNRMSSAKPADWKYQSFLDRWISLTADITVDFHIPVATEMASKSLKKQIQLGITPTCENIWNSLAVLNRQLYKENEPLDSSSHTPGGKKRKQKEELSNLSFEVDLFSQMTKSDQVHPPDVTDCCAKMYVRGTMCCRAYVHNKALAKDGIKALKNDAIKSLSRRCELLCEDMLVDEEETDPKILYETPRRVFARLSDSPLSMSDYVFMDETHVEVIDRMKDLLALDLTEEHMEFECEKLPGEADLVKPEEEVKKTASSTNSSSTGQSQKSGVHFINYILGGAIAVVAAGISYMFLSES